MYLDLHAMGEAKAESAVLACGCSACMGKSTTTRDFSLDLPLTMLRGTVPSTVAAPPATSDFRITGTIGVSGEQDAYSFSLVAGTTYSFALRGTDGGLTDPFLGLFDANGDPIDFDDDGGAGITSLLTFTATATGTYYVTAEAFGAGDVGDYTLDVWVQRDEDQVPDTFAGAVEIEVGTTFGHIETSEDIDTYKVYLEAGRLYTFQLAAGADYNSDFLDLPPGEVDTILAIYGPDQELIGFNDDISFPNDISSGFSFTPTESGFYYLDVLGYPDQTGGYTLDITELDPALLDPLDAINWVNADNIPTVLVNGVETAYVYFGDSDENFGQEGDDGNPMVTIDWNAFERGQVMLALEEYTRILGINYVVTDDVDQATFRLLKTESEEYGAYFFPQDPVYGADQGVGVFNVLSGGWNLPGQASLQEGGYSFAVILHEFGHAHGLAHPHDNGGGSDVLLGVTAAVGSYGLYNLNQGVYTVMSYNDAWDFHPDGPTPFSLANIDSGWSGTLSAFDIAVLQDRYGAVERNTGNDVYRLGNANDQGTFYQTIWDTGGTDEIRYDGARASQIDLLAATLDYSPTGGGVVSFVDDIWGGYTIANGVVIENATGGSGNDVLLGNAANNVLNGRNGNDTLQGRGGDDTLIGGVGNDTMDGGAGIDTVDFADGPRDVTVSLLAGTATGAGTDTLIAIENIRGSRGADRLTGDNGSNRIKGETGADFLFGLGGNDFLFGDGDNDTLNGGTGYDELAGGAGIDRFVFDSLDGDLIRDWQTGEKVDLTFFEGARVSLSFRSGRTTVSVDTDRDGQFDDGFFTVMGQTGFSLADIILA